MSEGNSVTYLPPSLGATSRAHSLVSINKDFAPLRPGGKHGQLLRGPRRVVRLCVFAIVVPAVLITVPLYVRLVLYPPASYPMMPTDQRLLGRHVSSVWCQAQTTHMNGSFIGYLAQGAPSVKPNRRSHIMLHHLSLQDDVKEYWGFFLLKGSTVTISSCARWYGGQLMILRGVANLRRCAWIGEKDSAEGVAEDDDEMSNERHRLEEQLRKRESMTLSAGVEESDLEVYKGQETGSNLDFEISELEGSGSGPVVHLHSEERRQSITQLLREAIRMSKDKKEILKILHSEGKDHKFLSKNRQVQNASKTTVAVASTVSPDVKDSPEHEAESNKTTTDPKNIESTLRTGYRSRAQGEDIKSSKKLKDETRQRRLRKQNLRRKKGNRRGDNLTVEEGDDRVRQRRQIQLEDGDENRDGAFEELDSDDIHEILKEIPSDTKAETAVGKHIFFPEGLKFERGKFNQTTANDNSREEHISSYSSSEEALASCEGVIMTLPLMPYRSCSFHNSLSINRIVYDIPITGTYYFVFSSDNEIYVNDLFFNITMERVVYNVTREEEICTNTTDCTMPLHFWSNEQAVVEVPQELGWDNAYVLDTKCEPRVYVYLTLLLLVPLCIMCCAFH